MKIEKAIRHNEKRYLPGQEADLFEDSTHEQRQAWLERGIISGNWDSLPQDANQPVVELPTVPVERQHVNQLLTAAEAVSLWTGGKVNGRPEYYLGMAPSRSLLDSHHLSCIYAGLYYDVAPEAADLFSVFVSRLKDFSPTAFLVAFSAFWQSGFDPNISLEGINRNTITEHGTDRDTAVLAHLVASPDGNSGFYDHSRDSRLNRSIKSEFAEFSNAAQGIIDVWTERMLTVSKDKRPHLGIVCTREDLSELGKFYTTEDDIEYCDMPFASFKARPDGLFERIE